jgi:hypothetical protein
MQQGGVHRSWSVRGTNTVTIVTHYSFQMLTLPLPLPLLLPLKFLYPGEDGKLKDVMDRISAGDTVREAHLQFMSKSIQIKHKHILLDCNAVFNTRGEFSYARSVKRLCAL